MTELALGTVQLGMPYGVTNNAGQVTAQEAQTILDAFAEDGGRWLDTAPAYGSSEALLRRTAASFAIVDKTIHLDATDAVTEGMQKLHRGLLASLQTLGRASVDTLLCHQAWLVKSPWRQSVLDWLAQLKSGGYVKQAGVSIYQPGELDEELLNHLDWVQFPLNVLDQRMLDSGWLERLHRAGVTTQARSLYMQGVLLSPDGASIDIPSAIRARISAFHNTAVQRSIMPEALALAFGRWSGVDQLVVGVNSLAEYRQLRKAWHQAEQLNASTIDWGDYLVQDSHWLNPSTWSRKV